MIGVPVQGAGLPEGSVECEYRRIVQLTTMSSTLSAGCESAKRPRLTTIFVDVHFQSGQFLAYWGRSRRRWTV